MRALWYRLKTIPDLTLNKYSSLGEKGVKGVLQRHNAFLRQLNRKGIVSSLSYHLYYVYVSPEDGSKDMPGHRLQVFFMILGEQQELESVRALITASPLRDYFTLENSIEIKNTETGNMDRLPCTIENAMAERGLEEPSFKVCAFLAKPEVFLSKTGDEGTGDGSDHYFVREWEMNEEGRLYDMCKIMEAIGHTALYRVDLYPVDRSEVIRKELQRRMRGMRGQGGRGRDDFDKDYDGKDILGTYEKLIEKYDSTPHFITNIMVMAQNREDAVTILDAAGSESLSEGRYSIAVLEGTLSSRSFLAGKQEEKKDLRSHMLVRSGDPGLVICSEKSACMILNYMPVLFSIEEVAPFFRFPALYDGETIQIAKETAPRHIRGGKDVLFLGKDSNGYDVNFPLKYLPKHAFIAGVPGSGKTNTMHHITSSLWKVGIPFLVLEPAKKEYRALANDPDMKGMYLFSPNADMSFPLHINPFEMPKGILVAEHIRMLCTVFEGAFPLEPPMPFLLDQAIEKVYRDQGWIPEHKYTGEEKGSDGVHKLPLPTMTMLYKQLEEELKTTRYSGEVRGNLESALKVRIGSLLRREMGDVFDVPLSTFAPERWLEVPAVVELESMGRGPANFLTLMLCSLIRETLKVNPKYDKGDVRHVIFIEEAHNLIGPESEEQSGKDADPKRAATAFVVKMLAEVRALKEGIVIADQLPTVMAQEVLKNTGLKIGLRITSADDRALLGSTMAANDMQLEQMATFAVGEALIFYEDLMRPFKMRVKEWWGEIQDKAQKEAMVSSKDDEELKNALAAWDTYREENLKSMEIIAKKYESMCTENNERLNNCYASLDTFTGLIQDYENKIKQLDRELYDAQSGKIQISKKEIYELDDEMEQLKIDRDLGKEEYSKEPLAIFKMLADWVKAIERLINGRWSNIYGSKDLISRVIKLQSVIYENANALQEESKSLWMEKDEKYIKNEMKILSEIYRKNIERTGKK